MAFDDLKLPRATVCGDNLYIEGETEPYFRDPKHRIALRIDALRIHRGYEPDYASEGTSKVLTEFLRGTVKLEEGDQFAAAGVKTGPDTPIEFQLRPVADAETKFHWRTSIGFAPYDWKRDRHARFWVNGYCSRQYFDDLLAAVRRGHIANIRVSMETTMWSKDGPYTMGFPRTWYVVAPSAERASGMLALEHGTILSLTWEEEFGDLGKETDVQPTTLKPQFVDLPTRFYSILGPLFAFLVLFVIANAFLTFGVAPFVLRLLQN